MVKRVSRVQFTLRLPDDIYDRLLLVAEKEQRSINNQIEIFVTKGIEAHERKHKKK